MLTQLQTNSPAALSHIHHCRFPNTCTHTHCNTKQLQIHTHTHTGHGVATGAQQPVSISRDWIILSLPSCPYPHPHRVSLSQTLAQTGLKICVRAEVDIIFTCPLAFHSAYFSWLQGSGYHVAKIWFIPLNYHWRELILARYQNISRDDTVIFSV